MERKQLFDEIIPADTSLIAKVKYIEGHGPAYYDAVQQQGLEGIVLKRKDSRYEVGRRSNSWLKVIKATSMLISVILFSFSVHDNLYFI